MDRRQFQKNANFESAPNIASLPSDPNLTGEQFLNDQSSPRLQMLHGEPSNMFAVDQADPDVSHFQSNYDAMDLMVTDGRLHEHHLRFDDLPLAV